MLNLRHAVKNDFCGLTFEGSGWFLSSSGHNWLFPVSVEVRDFCCLSICDRRMAETFLAFHILIIPTYAKVKTM